MEKFVHGVFILLKPLSETLEYEAIMPIFVLFIQLGNKNLWSVFDFPEYEPSFFRIYDEVCYNANDFSSDLGVRALLGVHELSHKFSQILPSRNKPFVLCKLLECCEALSQNSNLIFIRVFFVELNHA